jgi:hypothetical protein
MQEHNKIYAPSSESCQGYPYLKKIAPKLSEIPATVPAVRFIGTQWPTGGALRGRWSYGKGCGPRALNCEVSSPPDVDLLMRSMLKP